MSNVKIIVIIIIIIISGMNKAKQGGMQHTKGRLREVLKKKWKNKIMHGST